MSSSIEPENFTLQTISFTAHNQSANNAKTDESLLCNSVLQLSVRDVT